MITDQKAQIMMMLHTIFSRMCSTSWYLKVSIVFCRLLFPLSGFDKTYPEIGDANVL